MDDNDDIIWENPGVERGADSDVELARFPETLRARPGQWARITERDTLGKANAILKRIKTGKGIWHLEGGGYFEGKQGKRGYVHRVWARYVEDDDYGDGGRPTAH